MKIQSASTSDLYSFSRPRVKMHNPWRGHWLDLRGGCEKVRKGGQRYVWRTRKVRQSTFRLTHVRKPAAFFSSIGPANFVTHGRAGSSADRVGDKREPK